MARPLVIIGGYLTSPDDYKALAQALSRPPFDFQVFITPIGRLRWALTRDWDFRPVLRILRATVAQALQETGANSVTILAHSVGGTVARMYLGDHPYKGEIYGGHRFVHHLIMLGTPHHSKEFWTRQTVGFTNQHYPGAYYNHIRYTSIIGRSIQANRNGRWIERMAYNSYVMIDGPSGAQAWGDGITTLTCAALPGAEYLVVPGLYHSSLHGRPWYGDPEGLKNWQRVLVGSSPVVV
jgi:alpha-beta hydrolase superfamily lysophospholipase